MDTFKADNLISISVDLRISCDAACVVLFVCLIPDPTVTFLQLSPVADGDFIPEEPSQLFHNAADIDYLAGVNDMDGHLFTAQDIPSLGNKNAAIPV